MWQNRISGDSNGNIPSIHEVTYPPVPAGQPILSSYIHQKDTCLTHPFDYYCQSYPIPMGGFYSIPAGQRCPVNPIPTNSNNKPSGPTLKQNAAQLMRIEKLKKKRENNKIAARKCREKKNQRIKVLEKRVAELMAKNEKLEEMIKSREESELIDLAKKFM